MTAVRAEMCAVLLLLRPQLDAIAQIVNAEVLGSAIPAHKADIHKVAQLLDSCDDFAEVRHALTTCLADEHFRHLNGFCNMIKHAPAMGLTHAAMKPIGGGGNEARVLFPPV
ncbi:MAG TPA: hypothetical protein GX513_03815 [Firmicutes bacterium]|nr:hypothetical protein [Bacillota bacterium]